MATALDEPGSEGDLWREILDALRQSLLQALGDCLRFADPQAVTELALAQWVRNKPPREELEGMQAAQPASSGRHTDWVRRQAQHQAGLAAAASFVRDCESVAEYQAPGTGKKRRAAIREEFRLHTHREIENRIEALFEGQGCLSPGDAAVERLCGQVQDKLFSEAGFGKLASSYQPARQRTFERYLLWKAFRLAQDCMRSFFKKEPPMVSLSAGGPAKTGEEGPGRSWLDLVPGPEAASLPDPDGQLNETDEAEDGSASSMSLTLPPSEPESLGVQRAKERLEEVLGWLCDHQVNVRPRALVFLYYVAYVEPDIIPDWVVRQVVGGRAGLREDYLAAQQRLEQVRCKFLEGAAGLEAASSLLRRKREELRRRFGLLGGDLLDLELIARQSPKGELDEELQASGAARQEKWACQVEYMRAWKDHERSLKAYEECCGELKNYLEFRKPWIRSQKELAGLLGAPQGTIGRELADVRKLLQGCARAERLLEGLDENE